MFQHFVIQVEPQGVQRYGYKKPERSPSPAALSEVPPTRRACSSYNNQYKSSFFSDSDLYKYEWFISNVIFHTVTKYEHYHHDRD